MARLFLFSLLLLLPAAPARADSLREEAHLHYEVGRIAYEKQHWADALGEFKKAYGLVPIPDLIYNIGRCQEQLGQTAEAVASYRVYLATLTNPADIDELRARIALLERTVAPVVTSAPPLLAQSAAPVEKKPVSRRWWLWTGVGVVVVGVALGVGLGVGLAQKNPRLDFPGVMPR